jgi:hypothetical protein
VAAAERRSPAQGIRFGALRRHFESELTCEIVLWERTERAAEDTAQLKVEGDWPLAVRVDEDIGSRINTVANGGR